MIKAVSPTTLLAGRGVWLLTWKSQLRWRRLPMLAIMLGFLPALAFLTVREGRPEIFFRWAIDFYLTMLLPLYSLSICGAMVRDELQANTMGFLITRPISRSWLFLLKFFCNCAWLQIMGIIVAALLLLVGQIRQVEGLVAFAPIFLGTQVLAILAYGALAALIGLVSQRYMVLGIIYGFIVEIGFGQIPTNINNLSQLRHLHTILANNEALQSLYPWVPDQTALSVTILLVSTVVFLAVGAWLFTVREYHATDEMRK